MPSLQRGLFLVQGVKGLRLVLPFVGRGASDLAAWQQASSVLVALVQALLPAEGPEGLLDEADEQRLGKPALLLSMTVIQSQQHLPQELI
jgi:hypothetical protein